MTFDDWYLNEIGVTVADAARRGVYDMDLMRRCWDDSGAASRVRCAATVQANADACQLGSVMYAVLSSNAAALRD